MGVTVSEKLLLKKSRDGLFATDELWAASLFMKLLIPFPEAADCERFTS